MSTNRKVKEVASRRGSSHAPKADIPAKRRATSAVLVFQLPARLWYFTVVSSLLSQRAHTQDVYGNSSPPSRRHRWGHHPLGAGSFRHLHRAARGDRHAD